MSFYASVNKGEKLQLDTETADEFCILSNFLEESAMSVEEVAEAIGDSPLRLYRVLEELEPLGRTATLAIIALKNNLPEILPGD